MLKKSESYIVSIDMSSEDETVLAVAKMSGNKLEIINTLYGEHAEQMYERLTNISLERRNENV